MVRLCGSLSDIYGAVELEDAERSESQTCNQILAVVGFCRVEGFSVENTYPVFDDVAVVMSCLEERSAYFQTQVPPCTRSEADVRTVDACEVLDGLGSLDYFQD